MQSRENSLDTRKEREKILQNEQSQTMKLKTHSGTFNPVRKATVTLLTVTKLLITYVDGIIKKLNINIFQYVN